MLRLTLRNLAQNDSGLYQVMVSNSFGSVKSTTNHWPLLLVKPRIPQFPAHGFTLDLVEGQFSSGFGLTVPGVTPISYQWYKEGQLIPGATDSALSIGVAAGSVALSDAGEYRLVASNAYGSATSGPVVVTVRSAPPSFFVQPAPMFLNLTKGETISFEVRASGSPPLAYQWYKNGAPLPGAASTTLNIAPAQTADSGTYYAVATDPQGRRAESFVSYVTVDGEPVIG